MRLLRLLRSLVPFQTVWLRTALPADEIRHRLQAHIGPRRRGLNWGASASGYCWEGYVQEMWFKFNRIISYRNSFLPIAEGTIYPYGDRTELFVQLKPHTFLLVFLGVWLSVVVPAGLIALLALLLRPGRLLHGDVPPFLLVPVVLLAVGLLLPGLAFRGEAKRAKDWLQSLLDAEEMTRPKAGRHR